jgi:4-hydroxy 2-oxovalerate aldolase
MNDHIFDVRITDTSLRDGSHHKRHQFTKEEVQAIVAALDAAGVPVIEVTHGDGLGGSSFNYGFSKTPEQELIKIAAETVTDSKIAFLMLPGVGTKDDIREAQNNGGSICRIATHCTEADVSIQHFGLARELGLETVGFLMMAHTLAPEKLAAQARIMATPAASASTWWTPPGHWCSTRWPIGWRRWWPNSGRMLKSVSMVTRISAWEWPIRWRRCAPAPSRSTAVCGVSGPAPATPRSRR